MRDTQKLRNLWHLRHMLQLFLYFTFFSVFIFNISLALIALLTRLDIVTGECKRVLPPIECSERSSGGRPRAINFFDLFLFFWFFFYKRLVEISARWQKFMSVIYGGPQQTFICVLIAYKIFLFIRLFFWRVSRKDVQLMRFSWRRVVY